MNDLYNFGDEIDLIAENPQSTVIARYVKPDSVADGYQSENELESAFIKQLERQGYEHLKIHSEEELVANLRRQLQRLNNVEFTDDEWERFFRQEIASENLGIVEKAKTIQVDYRKPFTFDDGTEKNILLIDKKDIHNNITQVINQYEAPNGKRPNRYDVTVLVNGLPLVHIELKRRGVSIKEAFNQIERYGHESFWSGNALFEYVQIFVISNGTYTKYYSNTTRSGHLAELAKNKRGGRPQTSHSFEFTSYWADQGNNVLNDLEDFTATFFSRHTLLNVLTRYCIFTEQKLLLVMRPYQIAATERLLNQIEKAHNRRRYGTKEAGGYIWHTTGSGKTLTSFKAAQLVRELPYIDKVLFVVDRKDLDYQTMKEYENFQKGATNGNTSTRILEQQLRGNDRIIITTIQKLSNLVKKHPRHEVFDKEVVLIFDECHRSQFGEMHDLIVKKFKRYYMFGFTGTPIFTENMQQNRSKSLELTTDDRFGTRLHTYTIVDAIRDRNVLPFRVSYVRTIAEKEDIPDEKVWNIDREKAFFNPKRITNVSQYILDHFDRQTLRSEAYHFNRLQNIEEVVRSSNKREVEEIHRKERLNGFNSIFAVQSIEMAKLYYDELHRLMEQLPENRRLRIATIFSFGVNDEIEIEENSDSTEGLAEADRDFLDRAISDYNATFGTSYDTSADKFPNYYKDVSMRMKNRQIDLLIVVNMFLTGFDATTLNTLWVDKNMRYHGLIQGFSRTNRILNSVKTWGNIICFRNLEDATNKALALFGDNEAHSTTILRPFEDYYNGYTDDHGKHVKGYIDIVKEFLERFSPGVAPLTEKDEKVFIRLFNSILRFRNLLKCFDEFESLDPISERDMQDFTSTYNDLHDKYRNREKHDATDIADDVEFEMELVKKIEVNIDYILYLVNLYKESHCRNGEIRVKIRKAIGASPDLRDKKELIEMFIDSITPDSDVDVMWAEFINRKKREDFSRLIEEEKLKEPLAIKFIEDSFSKGYIAEGGTEIYAILPPVHPFKPVANRQGIFVRVLGKLKAFFQKYYEVANGDFSTATPQ